MMRKLRPPRVTSVGLPPMRAAEVGVAVGVAVCWVIVETTMWSKVVGMEELLVAEEVDMLTAGCQRA